MKRETKQVCNRCNIEYTMPTAVRRRYCPECSIIVTLERSRIANIKTKEYTKTLEYKHIRFLEKYNLTEDIVSLHQYKTSINMPCYICGEVSLDNNIVPYHNQAPLSLKNMITCCSTCRYIKGAMQPNHIISHAILIANHHNKNK